MKLQIKENDISLTISCNAQISILRDLAIKILDTQKLLKLSCEDARQHEIAASLLANEVLHILDRRTV